MYTYVHIYTHFYTYLHIYTDICVCVCKFNSQAGVLYLDLKHEAIAECFRFDKARTASFLGVF